MPTSPTGKTLPGLIYNPQVRVGGEFWLWANFGKAYKYGSIGIDSTGTKQYRAEASCGSASSPPVSGFAAVRALTALNSGGETTWGVTGKTGVLPAYAPPGQAAEIGSNIVVPTLANVISSSVEPGDSADIYVLPNPANDFLICFDQGFNPEYGDQQKAVPRKFSPVDHYVRQRPNNQLTLADLYVCNTEGLASIMNRNVTLIGKFFPDGGAIASEIMYYTNVRLNVPKQIPDDVNEFVKVSATGSFNDQLIFTEPRPT